MAIQSAINSMLGTAGTVSAITQHLDAQKKEISVKKAEAEKEMFNTENELKQNTTDITHQMVLEGNDAGLEPKKGETPEQAEQRAVDEYLEAKSEAAENRYQEQMDKVKHPEKSIRVELARKAADQVQDEINARRNLKFDLDIAKKKLKALGGKL